MTNNSKTFNAILSWIIIFLFLSLPVKSQDIKKVTNRPCEGMVEQYYVLKSNKEVKNGPYRLEINNLICQIGYYKNNERTGTWQIFSANKKLEFKYNFETKQLTDLDKGFFMNPGDTTSRAPVFLGGSIYLLFCVGKNIKHPNGLHSTMTFNNTKAIVAFDIDTLGRAVNHRILTSSKNSQLDFEAIRAVKQASTSDFSFLPSLAKGKPCTMPYMIPVVFSF